MTEEFILPFQQRDVYLFNPANDCCTHFIQAEGSVLNIHWVQVFTNRDSCNHLIKISQKGVGSRVYIYGVACLGGEAQINFNTLVEHCVPNGYSTQLFKYIVGGSARGSFDGRVIIAPDAQKTEVSQICKTILSSDLSKMDARPQLEIYADDVKASHGTTTGHIDESLLFYIQQRGISKKIAYKLLLKAFLEDVIQHFNSKIKKAEADKMLESFLNNFMI